MAIKITKIDKVFSRLVRRRSNWTCDRCGTYHGPSSTGLHCSHFFGRSNQGTRFMPTNCFSHCYGCHSYLGGHPSHFQRWATEQLGETTVADLMRIKNAVVKLTPKDKEAIYRQYKRMWEEEILDFPPAPTLVDRLRARGL